MANPAWLNKYLTMKPEVTRVFDDLEAYLNWCRFELQPFNPADLYRKDSATYSSYLNSRRPRKPYQGNKPWNKNRYDKNISS